MFRNQSSTFPASRSSSCGWGSSHEIPLSSRRKLGRCFSSRCCASSTSSARAPEWRCVEMRAHPAAQTFLGFRSQEAVNILMWWIGWSRSVGWLLRYNGPQNTWHKMIFRLLTFLISADRSFHFCLCWAVSLHVCAWQRCRAEQFGYCAWRYSEMARNERNEEKSLQWNSANCFPLYFWPSWTTAWRSESRKAPLWSLSRGEAVFLGGLFPRL